MAQLQPAKFHKDIPTADGLEIQLEQLRTMWSASEPYSPERDVIERCAYGVQSQLTTAQFREGRYEDEAWFEPNTIANIDAGYEDARLNSERETKTDSEWLSWKVNQFIKNISYRSKSGQLYLRAGRKSIALSGNGQWVEFTCYGCANFHGRHYVGGNPRMASAVIARVLAHTYKHA